MAADSPRHRLPYASVKEPQKSVGSGVSRRAHPSWRHAFDGPSNEKRSAAIIVCDLALHCCKLVLWLAVQCRLAAHCTEQYSRRTPVRYFFSYSFYFSWIFFSPPPFASAALLALCVRAKARQWQMRVCRLSRGNCPCIFHSETATTTTSTIRTTLVHCF